MRLTVSLLVFLLASVGATGAWGGSASDLAPMMEHHVEVEIETETEADGGEGTDTPALPETRGGLAAGLAEGVLRGIPPTPPPER